MASTIGRTSRIFVSDLHMGDAESLNPPGGLHPYGWLYADRAKMFADFLELKLKGPMVKELIILGDLFDEWVCPTVLDPVPPPTSLLNQFQKIARSSQNTAVITNLRAIADSDDIDLIYVPGNHDMLINEEIITEIIPGIVYMGTAPGEGVFTADGIVAEHGSMYCLFNAPDSYNNPGHVLPLGYFIARMVAEKVAETGSSINYLEVLAETILRLLGASDFAQAVFESIVETSGLSGTSQIKMSGVDGYSESVQVLQVEKWFADLYDQWNSNMPNNVIKEEAVMDDTGYLFPAAISQYFRTKGKADIVIFGHTHIYEIHGLVFAMEEEPREKKLEESEIPYEYIYANSGTWINQKKLCTFVETQIDESAGKHYVRLMQYTRDGSIIILGERYKNL
ncbi:MAG TPA: hypothetical protein ENH24_03855 [Nitrospirae bacterium]|nr:hypothetical protein [Nitrospirota bacterium]